MKETQYQEFITRTEFEENMKNIGSKIDKIETMFGEINAKFDRITVRMATKDDLKAFATKDDLKAFATKEDLKAFATKDDLKAFATKDDLKAFATKDDLKAFATKHDLQESFAGFVEALDNFATKDDLQDMLQEYPTKNYLHDALALALSNHPTKEDLMNYNDAHAKGLDKVANDITSVKKWTKMPTPEQDL